jgi:uncharacterized Zn-binding protein involved in type VI secretion
MKVLVLASVVTLGLCGDAVAQAPAARLGDATSHPGGSIVQGSPTVMIGGLPAARVLDLVVCPVVDPPLSPADSPHPHVGGSVVTGSSSVFIDGRPAARVGSIVNEAPAPQSVIVGPGAVTVLIGG